MPDTQQFPHLSLPKEIQGKPKLRGHGTGSPQTKSNRANRSIHGAHLQHQISALSRFWHDRRAERRRRGLPDIKADIPLLLEVDPTLSDISFLKGLGFEIVCETAQGYILVASKDADLSILQQKTAAFIENIKKRCNAPAKIYALCEDQDRLNQVLSEGLLQKWDSLAPEGMYIVDISVSCSDSKELPAQPIPDEKEPPEHFSERMNNWQKKCCNIYADWDETKMRQEMELEDFIAAYGGKILDMTEPPEPTARFSTLPDSFSARLRISGAGLRDLVLNWAYLFEVTEAETVKINPTMDDTAGDTVFPSILPPPSFSPIVCVIDSGIQEGHKYLSDAIIKEDSLSLLPRNPSVTDEAGTSGHGTRVAGAVLYPDGLPRQGTYQLPCRLRNLRVLDRDNCLPPALYPPRIIEKAVRIYHHEKSQRTKIFNQSIGANTACRLTHMSAWAAAIDNQSYENDILFIQAAGNISSSTIKHFLQHDINYPDYFKEDAARISNPAQSLQALTVGSVSSSDFETKDLIALGRMDEVSSFSRCGPGIWDTIKPDVVEYGGTQVCTKDHKMPLLTTPPPVCPELLRKSPEGCAYARDDVGTSFAAPKVASIAARLEQLLPDSPALLYRALIAQSARWPTSADHISKETALSLIRHMGYGIPDLKRATENDDYRITLITPQLLQLGEGEAHIFQIPIPEELSAIDKDYDILLEITLSYAAKPRRTRRRVNGYLSTWLDWRCSRMGEAAENFSRRIFDTGKRVDDDGNFHWAVGEQMNHGLLADISRRNGTLQKDWCLLKSNQLSDKFCIAVRGHKGWSSLFKAKYALAISIEAIHRDVAIYEPIRAEIESEIELSVSE